jgi:hypothetical protein
MKTPVRIVGVPTESLTEYFVTFKIHVLRTHLPGVTDEYHERASVNTAGVSAEIRTQHLI